MSRRYKKTPQTVKLSPSARPPQLIAVPKSVIVSMSGFNVQLWLVKAGPFKEGDDTGGILIENVRPGPLDPQKFLFGPPGGPTRHPDAVEINATGVIIIEGDVPPVANNAVNYNGQDISLSARVGHPVYPFVQEQKF